MTSVIDQLKDLSPMLAADIAADIWPPDVIFARHGVSDHDMMVLLASEWFQKMIQDAKLEWSSLKNSKSRVRLKGQLALEEAIPTIYQLINDPDIPGAARVAAFKELKDLSGVAASAAEGGGGGTGLPSVTIYLGNPEGPSITIGGAKKDVVPEAEVIEGLEFLDLKEPEVP